MISLGRVALLFFCVVVAIPAESFYITDGSQLYTLDTFTGNLSDSVTLSLPITGLAFQSGTGDLFTIAELVISSNLSVQITFPLATIDPVTGAVMPIGGNLQGFTQLAFEANGSLLGIDGNTVDTINPLSGAVSPLTSAQENGGLLASDETGAFFTNTQDGILELIGNSGSVESMSQNPLPCGLSNIPNAGTFDANLGLLACIGPTAPEPQILTDSVYVDTIDSISLTQPIGMVGVQLGIISIDPTVSQYVVRGSPTAIAAEITPEPASVWLVLSSGLMLLWWRRVVRRVISRQSSVA